jgi:hypothetical protein
MQKSKCGRCGIEMVAPHEDAEHCVTVLRARLTCVQSERAKWRTESSRLKKRVETLERAVVRERENASAAVGLNVMTRVSNLESAVRQYGEALTCINQRLTFILTEQQRRIGVAA